jgi:hypothetical protein
MALPSDDGYLYDLMRQDKMYLRIVYGLLPCGEGYAKLNADLVGAALQEGLVAPLYRDHTLNLIAQYNAMLKNFKPKKGDVPPEVLKEVTRVMGAVKKSVGEAEKFVERDMLLQHRQRRIYLCQELHNLLSIFRDKPGLLGPKMTLLLSILAFAKV